MASPNILWKYRCWNDYTKNMLQYGDVYFARARELNDPLEFRWRERWPLDADSLAEFVHDVCNSEFPGDTLKERIGRIAVLANESLELAKEAAKGDGTLLTRTEFQFGVFCACETPSQPIMWSHYANSHKGICVGLDTRKFGSKRFRPVEYCDTLPEISVQEYVGPQDGLFADLAAKKAKPWSYEKEWRTAGTPGVERFNGVVCQVVLGALAEEDVKKEVTDVVQQLSHPVTLLQASLSETEYSIELTEVDRSS